VRLSSLPAFSATGLLFTCTFCAGIALAAPCGTPEVSASSPPDGATGVPTNAMPSASYGAPVDFGDEVVVMTGPLGSPEIDVIYDEAENTLRTVPRAPLEPGAYTIEWPALRGVGTGRGRARTVTFEVDGGDDVSPPSFEGLTAIEWDLSREEDPCTDALSDRLVFELTFGTASDDRDTSLLQALVFATERPEAPGAAPLPIEVTAWPESGKFTLRRPAEHEGRHCFAALVRDLVGQPSGGAEREVCVETRHGPFFRGCGLGVVPSRTGIGGVFSLLVVAVWGVRRRGRGAIRRSVP
jgi:hypothetical protein